MPRTDLLLSARVVDAANVFRCWCPDCSDEGDAKNVEASRPEWAAERYAEWRDSIWADYQETRTIRVRTPRGELLEYEVTLRSEPVYSASSPKTIDVGS